MRSSLHYCKINSIVLVRRMIFCQAQIRWKLSAVNLQNLRLKITHRRIQLKGNQTSYNPKLITALMVHALIFIIKMNQK